MKSATRVFIRQKWQLNSSDQEGDLPVLSEKVLKPQNLGSAFTNHVAMGRCTSVSSYIQHETKNGTHHLGL